VDPSTPVTVNLVIPVSMDSSFGRTPVTLLLMNSRVCRTLSVHMPEGEDEYQRHSSVVSSHPVLFVHVAPLVE
jgi:hypothetical protein